MPNIQYHCCSQCAYSIIVAINLQTLRKETAFLLGKRLLYVWQSMLNMECLLNKDQEINSCPHCEYNILNTANNNNNVLSLYMWLCVLCC